MICRDIQQNESVSSPLPEVEINRWRGIGEAVGREIRPAKPHRVRRTPYTRNRRLQQFIASAANHPNEDSRCILENARLLYASEKDSRVFALSLREFPHAADPSVPSVPRVQVLAREYLKRGSYRVREDSLAAFVEGMQRVEPLQMGELWGLKPALQLEIIEALPSSDSGMLAEQVNSLHKISDANWNDWFESVSLVHQILATDPADVYLSMDFESRDSYRREIGELAKHSTQSESEVAKAAIALSSAAVAVSDGSRRAIRRTHVGFYLIDKGRPQIEAAIQYRAPFRSRFSRLVLRHPTFSYLFGIEFLTLLIIFGVVYLLGAVTPSSGALIFLLLPATQAACDFVNNLVTGFLPPRVLPKLDFSDGIPEDCTTLVAVPSLLLNEAQIRDLVLDLEIRFLANDCRNLYFALLTDSPDSDHPTEEDDQLVKLCTGLIEGLNQRYTENGNAPFHLLHRHLAFNANERRWMGWERKRGKLLDLNKLLRGTFDAFPIKAGDTAALSRVRYVIALDSDTQLPRDSAVKLVGAIAHPLNHAVVHPVNRVVEEGYGILQPGIGIGIQSAARSRLASLYSGQTGFDIYTRAVSDVYQDLFAEGSFTGKGIYDVDAMREVLERRFPENALLSHDLIEGAYARVALVSDIQLIDDYPSHFSAYSRRKHRWVRGDWQIMRWLRPTVPDAGGDLIPNPISPISQWKILDNLRRSLIEPAFLFLFLGGWLFLPGVPHWWTVLAVALLFTPVFSGLLFALLRVPWSWRALGVWAQGTLRTFLEGAAIAACSLIFLLHQSLISLDAILRSIGRVFVTGRRMLEWETAAEAEAATRSKATVDLYLEWTPWIAIAIGIAVALLRPAALLAAAPILLLWTGSRAFSAWLNRPPSSEDRRINKEETQLFRDSAERIWRFFHDWSSSSTNWLIPDNVRDDGTVDLRLSPTNAGMLLNSRIAAVHLGLMPLPEFVFATGQTLNRLQSLRKYRGHLFNWYNLATLEPIPPFFVSTVDSGNLAASLWTLKQAAIAFAAEPPAERDLTATLSTGLQNIAEICDRLVREMDFRFLYDRHRKVLSVGFDADTGKLHPSGYTLLASESRIATFIAIAKGDIPQKAWFHLGRAHSLISGERVLISWTGTLFEYLMPSLWMRSHPETIIDQTMRAVVRVQREYGRSKGVPWGISESAWLGPNGDGYGYAAFGIPGLSTRPPDSKSLVISPYSSFLATRVDPAAAAENLTRIKEFGWMGRYGFYESIDYSQAGGKVVPMWMAHHQGMSLLSIVNLLHDCPFQRYFHAEPQVLATELLLHERVPAGALVEVDQMPVPEAVPVPMEA